MNVVIIVSAIINAIIAPINPHLSSSHVINQTLIPTHNDKPPTTSIALINESIMFILLTRRLAV